MDQRIALSWKLSVGLVLLVGVVLFVWWSQADVFWPGLIALLSFYGVMFLIGAAAQRNSESSFTGLALAGRSLPLSIGLLTMTATWVGGGYVNGTAEAAFSGGFANVQAPWGYALSLIIGGLLFAPRMHRESYTTMLDPIERRFGKVAAGLLYLPALAGEVFWTAAILTALGTTFAAVLGLDPTPSILISACIALTYTVFGGLKAVALTDVLQLVILIGGLWIVVPFAAQSAGGLSAVWDHYGAESSLSPIPPWRGWELDRWGPGYFQWWDFAFALIFGGLAWHVYFQRVLAAKSERAARGLSVGAGLLCVVAAVPPLLIGMIAKVTDWEGMGIAVPSADSVVPNVLRHLTPTWLGTIGLGALAAAVMSSVDSSVLSASSMATWNIYRPFCDPQADSRRLGLVLRVAIVGVGAIATVVALRVQSVYALWFLCSDFVYCILFPQLTLALFDRRSNRIGCYGALFCCTILRLGAGEPFLGLPRFLPYPWVNEGVSQFPFRTMTMLTGFAVTMLLSRAACSLATNSKRDSTQDRAVK